MDDTLVRSHRVRQQVRRMVTSHQAETLTVKEAHRLATRIQQKGSPGVQALLDCLFDEENPNTFRVALVLLGEIDDPALSEKIRELLKRPHLPEKVRGALLTVEALHEDSHTDPTAPLDVPDLPIDALLELAESFWESMDMEEISVMWRENFANEPPEHRLPVLDTLLTSAHPKLLGIARLEIALGDIKILQLVAQKLSQFESPLAATILKDLLDHADLVVRTLADQSLAQWRERAARASPQQAPDPPRPRFYRAHMATDQWSGQYSVLYAVRSPDRLIKFFAVLIDRWDRGIVDCWGGIGYSDSEFNQLLSSMARDFDDLRQERISKRTALTLLHKAMNLNQRRKHPLPLDLYVWIHLLENQRFQPDPDVPQFGVDCGVCHKPVRTGPRTPPWVLGKLVVCHRCSKRSLRCPTCSGPTTLAECFLSREDMRHQTDLRCPHCFESFQMPS